MNTSTQLGIIGGIIVFLIIIVVLRDLFYHEKLDKSEDKQEVLNENFVFLNKNDIMRPKPIKKYNCDKIDTTCIIIPWENNITRISSLNDKNKDKILKHVHDDLRNRLEGKQLIYPVFLSPAYPDKNVLQNLDLHTGYWNIGPIYDINTLVKMIVLLKNRISLYSRVEPQLVWQGGIRVHTYRKYE